MQSAAGVALEGGGGEIPASSLLYQAPSLPLMRKRVLTCSSELHTHQEDHVVAVPAVDGDAIGRTAQDFTWPGACQQREARNLAQRAGQKMAVSPQCAAGEAAPTSPGPLSPIYPQMPCRCRSKSSTHELGGVCMTAPSLCNLP